MRLMRWLLVHTITYQSLSEKISSKIEEFVAGKVGRAMDGSKVKKWARQLLPWLKKTKVPLDTVLESLDWVFTGGNQEREVKWRIRVESADALIRKYDRIRLGVKESGVESGKPLTDTEYIERAYERQQAAERRLEERSKNGTGIPPSEFDFDAARGFDL